MFWTLALVLVLTLPSTSQSVVSTHAGIVHYLEGAVYLGDQPLELHPGRFSNIPQGAELRTGEGRAEILLTPGVFLRMGERSTIRMLANELSDTRLELMAGSAIVDSAEPVGGTSVTLIYKNWSVHFLKEGVYRIDSNPPRLYVLEGQAEVSGNNAKALLVNEGACLPFAQVLVPDQTMNPPLDALSRWAGGRQQSIAADNAIAANIQDPASMDTSGGLTTSSGGFTYFPPLWLPPAGLSLSSLYSSQGPFQPGFNSVYLPGYSYLPLFFGIGRIGSPPVRLPRTSGHILTYPNLIPVRPVSALAGPVLPVHVMPAPPHPISPPPVAVHAQPSVGVHLGAHR